MKRYLLLFMASLLCFVSCYDDSDVWESLQDHENRIANLELLCNRMNTNISSMQTLLEAVQNNDYVKSVTPVMENGKQLGYTITFNKSQPITIYHGKDGDDGKPGADGRPGADGKPGQPGADGKPGRPGADGQDGRPGTDGHSPVIGAKLDTDGVYYWTLDGSWLLDDNGNKIKAVGTDGKDGQNGSDGQDGKPGTDGQDGKPGADGITPRLRIIEGYWEISYDNGTEWTRLGKATGENGQNGADGQNGDSMFQSITNAETTVTFVLSSGETIVLPKERSKELTITFDDFDIGVVPHDTISVGYTIHGGTSSTIVKAIAQNGWEARIQKKSETQGDLIVIAPYRVNEEEIIVLASDGHGCTTMSTINFVTGVITPSTEAIYASIEGGQYEVEVNANVEYSVFIPEVDKNWISIVPQTKSIRTDKLAFLISKNDCGLRHSDICLKDHSENIIKTIRVFQEGNVQPHVINVNGVEIPLIRVKGGSFTIGRIDKHGADAEKDESPTHQVTLSDYYIGQTEVTQELWEAVMGSNPSSNQTDSKNPVEQVSWNDIVNVFLPKLNALTGKLFCLPTEAQWEFAARGGNMRQGYKYSGSNNIDEVAWWSGNSGDKTHPVGQKLPNILGIYDMTGNVGEWCSDWYGKSSEKAQIDPTGTLLGEKRVFRGGGYYSDKSFHVFNCDCIDPDYRYRDSGFRLILSENAQFDKSSFTFIKGQTETLQIKVNGILPLTSGLAWTSSNPNVATVDANGMVTAVSVGTSVITVRLNASGKDISCNVEVVDGVYLTANGVHIPMVKVQGGIFVMGATEEQGVDAKENEKPAHQVILSDYYIGQIEVTQELWEAVMGSNPSSFENKPKNPVEMISRSTILCEFLPKLNQLTGKTFTLPTEAQWEYAARGGIKSKGYKYSGSNNLDEVAWYDGNDTPHETKPVGLKLPNELGIYDMSGNVMESCSDVYGNYTAEPQANPTGPVSGNRYVVRGGCFYEESVLCRISKRDFYSDGTICNFQGLRLALNL